MKRIENPDRTRRLLLFATRLFHRLAEVRARFVTCQCLDRLADAWERFGLAHPEIATAVDGCSRRGGSVPPIFTLGVTT